jgi:ketosteroid isomerase-like protein
MDAIEEARALVRSHEEYSAAGDVEGVLSNMAEDIVMLAPDAPLIEGKDAVRAAYEGFFSMGKWDFYHEYSGAEEVGEVVIFHGVAKGTMTPVEGDPVPLANNFILMLKRNQNGTLQFWRGGFAGSGG